MLPLLHSDTQISNHAAAPNRWPVLLCLFPMAAPSYPSAGQGSLMERPGGYVSAHPHPFPRSSGVSVKISHDRALFFWCLSSMSYRNILGWREEEKKKVTDLLPASQSLAGICSIRNGLSNCSLFQGIERHAPLFLTYISWGIRPMTSGREGILTR